MTARRYSHACNRGLATISSTEEKISLFGSRSPSSSQTAALSAMKKNSAAKTVAVLLVLAPATMSSSPSSPSSAPWTRARARPCRGLRTGISSGRSPCGYYYRLGSWLPLRPWRVPLDSRPRSPAMLWLLADRSCRRCSLGQGSSGLSHSHRETKGECASCYTFRQLRA